MNNPFDCLIAVVTLFRPEYQLTMCHERHGYITLL
jgi:hypothetical protein